MEITSTDFDDASYDPPFTEKLGKGALYLTALSALSIALPAAVKKKRTYVPISITPSVSPEPPPVEEPPSPASLPDLLGAIPPPRRSPTPVPSCTEEEKTKITELFGTIATSNVFSLGLNAGRLQQLGNEIEAIHPFSLLLTMPQQTMQQIFQRNSFVITNVMEGIQKGFEREKENLELYLPSFASQVNREESRISQLIGRSDWIGLVRYLFDIAP